MGLEIKDEGYGEIEVELGGMMEIIESYLLVTGYVYWYMFLFFL